MAAAGTPDNATDCNISSGSVADAGEFSDCVSNQGVRNVVGNLREWVADWGDRADGCATWPAGFGSDTSCLGGPGSSWSNLPGALVRGGNWTFGTAAGVFAVNGGFSPDVWGISIGFRCAR